jgi:hypothetical protein
LRLVITDVNTSLVAPVDPPGDFAAGAATTEWVAEDALLLLLQGNAGAQLSLVDPNGGGEVIADFNQPFVSYDVVP